MTVKVQYIGTRELYVEKLYRSGLTFTPGQVRTVSGDLARKLLRHVDIFKVEEQPKGEEAEQELPDEKPEDSPPDNSEEDLIAGLKDQISIMDKLALESFAREKYGQELDRRFGIEKLRLSVMEMIDQYGIV
jgi:hypothetical protein